jgi:hypothetical protein
MIFGAVYNIRQLRLNDSLAQEMAQGPCPQAPLVPLAWLGLVFPGPSPSAGSLRSVKIAGKMKSLPQGRVPPL